MQMSTNTFKAAHTFLAFWNLYSNWSSSCRSHSADCIVRLAANGTTRPLTTTANSPARVIVMCGYVWMRGCEQVYQAAGRGCESRSPATGLDRDPACVRSKNTMNQHNNTSNVKQRK